jgi:cobalt/nickel transport protein
MKLWQRNVVLGVLVVLLIGMPLFFIQGAEWGGADTLSTEAVQELQPDYQPWFESIFSPEENERYFFGFQALLGSLFLSGALGWMIGRYRARTGTEGHERNVATIIVAVAVVIGLALFLVTTEFGELQAFISALQGVAFGLLGFFLGYPLGQRGVATTSRTTARS